MPKFILLSFCLPLILSFVFAADIKEADLAGFWYSNEAKVLEQELSNYLDSAKTSSLKDEVVALICPHAGLVYSGPAAAYGFKAVEGKEVNRVILVGFSHRVDFDGIAAATYQEFKTPLGTLAIDRELTEKLSSAHRKIFAFPRAFENENSLELIIPFIQRAFDNPKTVLLAIGRQSWENAQILGDALAKVLKDESNYLIIASTDLSHYLPLAEALEKDRQTAELLEKMNPKDLFASASDNCMCGLAAVTSVMIAAKQLGANKLMVLNQSTSAEASGDESRVVGYLSAAMVRDKTGEVDSALLRKDDPDEVKKGGVEESGKMEGLLNTEQRKELLELARDTIVFYLDKGRPLERSSNDEALNAVMGVFVTLRKGRQLRGCIGNIIGRKPLYQGVRDMAIAAATEDSRFQPVTEDELGDIHIEISVLSPLKQITSTDEIVLGKHGVLVRDAYRSGVYLPQVATETGWSKDEFMNSLCGHKAGMASDAWESGKCDIYIFSAEVFEE